jgi:hypothetical protein
MLPHLESIQLPVKMVNMNTLDVICYDFAPQLLSLLHDIKLMTSNSPVLNPDEQLSMYVQADGSLGHAMSGSVYQGMYSRLVTDPSRQLLCPLIYYIDGTQIDICHGFPLKPFSFAFAILRSATCS